MEWFSLQKELLKILQNRFISHGSSCVFIKHLKNTFCDFFCKTFLENFDSLNILNKHYLEYFLNLEKIFFKIYFFTNLRTFIRIYLKFFG
jgi:hypothetical protein